MRQKKNNLKELAMDLKGDVNNLIWDYDFHVTMVEFTALYNLVHYMDVFILECFDDNGNLTNKKWIQKKLMTTVIYLGTSNKKELHRIMDKVIKLEDNIYSTEVVSNGGN